MKQDNRKNVMLYSVLASMGAFGCETLDYMKRNPKKNPLDGIDIEAEYELILQKKSNLNSAKRNMIVFIMKNKPEIDAKIAEETQKRKEKSDAIKNEINQAREAANAI